MAITREGLCWATETRLENVEKELAEAYKRWNEL